MKPKTTLPAFTPVPRLKERSNGWSAPVQRAFIEALAETGSVESACRRVNRSTVGAYQLRRHPEAQEFRAAWAAALDLGIQRIEDVAMDRALNGVEVPVYSYGKLVGTRTKYNDRLLMFMLRNRAPARFTEGGARALNALDKQSLARAKKQWRKEWEREKAVRSDADEQAGYDALHAKLARMHEGYLETMSPRTRAAYEEFQRLHAEDQANGYTAWLDPEARPPHPAAPDEPNPAVLLPPPNLILPGTRPEPKPAPERRPGEVQVRSLKGEWE